MSLLCFVALSVNDCIAGEREFNDSSYSQAVEFQNPQSICFIDYKVERATFDSDDPFRYSSKIYMYLNGLVDVGKHASTNKNTDYFSIPIDLKFSEKKVLCAYHRNQWNL